MRGGQASGVKIDVGGHRLWLRCVGQGTPPVVLDAGLGGTSASWHAVLPAVARFTRARAYNRAGLGASDPAPAHSSRTSEHSVEELRTLLARAGIAGPYVLVGHSHGGLNMRLYACRHPEGVAGLVLVEAAHEEAHERVSAARQRARGETGRCPHPTYPVAEGLDFPATVALLRAAGRLPDVPIVRSSH